MNEMKDMLQTMKLLAALQAQHSTKTAPSPSSESRSEFSKLMDRRTEEKQNAETPEGKQDGLQGEGTPTEPQDNTLREVAAAMAAMSGATAPVVIQIQEVLPTQEIVTALPIQPETQIQPQVQNQQSQGQPVAENTAQPIPEQIAKPDVAPTQNTGTAEQAAVQQDGAEFTVVRTPNQTQQSATPTETTSTGEPQTIQKTSQPGTQQNAGEDANTDLSRDSSKMETTQFGGKDGAQPLFRNVETTPVKVGETPVADTTAPDLDAQLAKQIDATLARGAQQVEIRLTPDNLGTVVINLTRTQDGSLEVVLHTTTDKAANLLNQHAGALNAMLQNGTQGTVHVEVQQQEQNQQFQQQNRQGGGQNDQQQRQQQQRNEDFVQQLRLGLVALNEQQVS